MASDQDSWTWAAMEPEPTDTERKLMDLFCEEFLVDMDATRAASRCGFQAAFAKQYGAEFYQRSYVQRRIAALQRAKLDEKKEREFDAVNTRARLRSIINDEYAKASARVAAARELNAMHGLRGTGDPKQVQAPGQRAGVILLPAIASLGDWEQHAQASQTALAEASRV